MAGTHPSKSPTASPLLELTTPQQVADIKETQRETALKAVAKDLLEANLCFREIMENQENTVSLEGLKSLGKILGCWPTRMSGSQCANIKNWPVMGHGFVDFGILNKFRKNCISFDSEFGMRDSNIRTKIRLNVV